MTTAAIEQDAPTTEQLQEALETLAAENIGLQVEVDELKAGQALLLRVLAMLTESGTWTPAA
jgi:hypothetical protein